MLDEAASYELTRHSLSYSCAQMKRTLTLYAVVLCLFASAAVAIEPGDELLPPPNPLPPLPNKKLVVGVAVGPPFNIRNPDGSWTGISVDLWRQIASELRLDFEFRETDLSGYFAGLAEGWLDVAIGPLTITERREEVCDFTQPYFSSSLAVAVRAGQFSLVSFKLLRTIGNIVIGLLLFMTVVAAFVWLCERKENAEQFGGKGSAGFGSAVWWSSVTMTGIGYGDITPKTLKGRIVAVSWMLISLVLISTFTATIASILTAERLGRESSIRGLDDLRQIHVGTFANSSTAQYLEANHIDYEALSRDELFQALKTGKIQAIFYDEPFLRSIVRNKYRGQFTIVRLNLETQLYAFALREASPLRERINRILLRKIHDPAWRDLLYRYLGSTTQFP